MVSLFRRPTQQSGGPASVSKTTYNASAANTQRPLPKSVSQVEKRTFSRLFALIIGVNEYKDKQIPNLSGAVTDANAVQDFFRSLGTRPERIINLRNSEATKSRIIASIDSLASNNAIEKSDPILIYFAGHGSQTDAPRGVWETSDAKNQIQMILPHDFVRNGSTTSDGQGIWDITLSKLLEKVAKAKSDNITVIFDCCHSGSGTRNDLNTRGVELPDDYAIPMNVFESEIGNHRATSIPQEYQSSGMMSHVLLAACKKGQVAKEVSDGSKQRGAFTLQLFALLAQGIGNFTYQEAIEKLPQVARDQDPQCEGVNRNRVVFTTSGKNNTAPPTYHLTPSTMSGAGMYVLQAGSAHGITPGAIFSVYSDSAALSQIGSVKAVEVGNYQTTCSFHGAKSPFILYDQYAHAFAIQTQIGTNEYIQICVKDKGLRERLESARTPNDRFRLVEQQSGLVDLVITQAGSRFRFEIMDQICRKNEMKSMPFDVDVDITKSQHNFLYILSILRKAADFYWHLRRVNSNPAIDKTKVGLDCFKLVRSDKPIDCNNGFYRPLVPTTTNFCVNGAITITVNEDDIYGFRINNLSKCSLYVALFYFDISDLSIQPYYLPGNAASGNVDFSIPPNGSLPIGYGDSGTPCQVFTLREGQNVDVGFLKLYMCTKYVDFAGIAQESPFETSRGTQNWQSANKTPDEQLWGTVTIPIIQRAAKARGGFNWRVGGILSRCFRFLDRS